MSLTKLPFIMAADYGIYEKNNLKIQQYITPSAAKADGGQGRENVPPENIGHEEGIINIGGGSPTMVRMHSVTTAPQRVILATTGIYSRYHILSRADIKTIEDVKGKRIGYGNPGALSHFSILMWLKSIGLDPEKDVEMYSNGGDIEHVTKGKVDIITANGITVEEAVKQGMNDIANLVPKKIHMPGSGVNAEVKWLKDNRDVAARFVKATVEAIALMKTDKEKAFASMRKWYGITDPKVAGRHLRRGHRPAEQALPVDRRPEEHAVGLHVAGDRQEEAGRFHRCELRHRARQERLYRRALQERRCGEVAEDIHWTTSFPLPLWERVAKVSEASLGRGRRTKSC